MDYLFNGLYYHQQMLHNTDQHNCWWFSRPSNDIVNIDCWRICTDEICCFCTNRNQVTSPCHSTTCSVANLENLITTENYGQLFIMYPYWKSLNISLCIMYHQITLYMGVYFKYSKVLFIKQMNIWMVLFSFINR